MSEDDQDWKLKLRYGRVATPFEHFTVIAEGEVGTLTDGFECRPGCAFMGMKVWAMSTSQADDMIQSIGGQIGFRVAGRIQVNETEPTQPPKDRPYGYDIQFTPFEKH